MKLKRLRMIGLPLLVAVFSQLYFYPFVQSGYRISAGIIVLNFILLVDSSYPPFLLSLASGAVTVLLRCIVDMALGGGGNAVLAAHLPTLVFYAVFGALAQWLKPSRMHSRPVMAVGTLLFLECAANLAETLARRDLGLNILAAIAITALVRTLLATIPLEIYLYHRLFVTESEHQQRYEQLNLMASDICAEAFYLKKSAKDINEVMAKSYKLFDDNRANPEVSAPALEISRAVHEISKDYRRLQSGLEGLVANVEEQREMKLSTVLDILSDNTRRGLKQSGSHITFTCKARADFAVRQYYTLFSILGNLISNAIDACGQDGAVELCAGEAGVCVTFAVKDNGCGIAPDVLPYIFGAGFTTKFSESGAAGTGIGLCHVKNMAESLGGEIKVESAPESGTIFTVILPKESI